MRDKIRHAALTLSIAVFFACALPLARAADTVDACQSCKSNRIVLEDLPSERIEIPPKQRFAFLKKAGNFLTGKLVFWKKTF